MPTPETNRTPSPRVRQLIGFSAVVMLIFCCFVAYQGLRGYRQAMHDGKNASAQLARIMADHAELTLLGVDLSLRRAIERQYFNSLFGNNLTEYTEQNFRVWLNETPQVAALALINENGVVQVAAHKKAYEHWLDYHKSMAGQKLFEHMRDADDSYVFIGKHTTPQNDTLMIMSRRYNKTNGEFGGVVVAAVNPTYFTDFYHSIAPGKERFMALMLQDSTVLISAPGDLAREAEAQAALTETLASGDTLQNAAVVQKSSEMVALAHLKHMPIVISVLTANADFLSGWYSALLRDLGFLLMFLLFGSILSFLAIAMARQILRVEESEAAAILASQAKSEFLANMSHELRTPLNAIIGFSEMINSGYFGPLNTKQKERIHDINLCGSHLLQLITDILEFSKGDAGKLELIEEPVSLGDIVNESVRIMNGKLKSKQIQTIVAAEPDLPNLWGDKRKIRQILINLISNAIKFTPENGAITINVRQDATHHLVLTITDTGIGIAEQDIVKALSVFGQVHRSKSHEGTGLGLPLCKMYAELHDGTLQLTSKLGEGTTVRVIFPAGRTMAAQTNL